MPLIPFPDIPQLPGVPAIPRSRNIPTPIASTSSSKLPSSTFGVQWGFVDANGGSVITPDSFIDFEYREEHKVPNYPVEGGSFSSYNKVAMPFDLRVTVSCNGRGSMTKETFLSTIEKLIKSLTLINVITPNATYNNCNLIHFDYRREARRGVSLIIAQLWFQEIRISQVGTVTTTTPSATPKTNNGQVTPVPPTNKQKATINSKSFKIDFGDLNKGWY